MADTLLQTPYATAMPYVVASPGGWTDEYDRQRLASYNLYDDLYNNDPSTYRLLLRAADERPIYVPTAKRIVKTLARYVGKGWGFSVLANDPDMELSEDIEAPTPEQITLAKIQYGKLFARERLLSRYRAGVPEWLRRGDWCWFITADPNKREGSRISVRPIDPRRYFPINGDPMDLSRVTGQQLVEETMEGDTIALYVQTWLKSTDPAHPDYDPEAVESDEPPFITYQAEIYDVADYIDPLKRKLLRSVVGVDYVAGITQLPIYHIKNNEGTDDPFGRSDLSGLESIVAGINQTISDEDLSLAMSGLGQYWTDSGAPVDETTGQPTSWKLGPKRVIEVEEGTSFNRVEGITSVSPFQDHSKYLEDQAIGTVGLSDVAVGTSSDTPESGVALSIRYSPTIDEVRGKDEQSNGVLTQMLWDLKEWFLAFEQIDLGSTVILSVTDNPESIIPFDREARWKELMEGVLAKVFTIEYAIGVLESEFGYDFPAGYAAATAGAATEAAAAEQAELDAVGARAEQELNTPDEGDADVA